MSIELNHYYIMGLNLKNKYDLMHKDRKVIQFDLLGNVKILDKNFLPYGLYVEEKYDVETCANNSLNIINWLARRVINIDRKYSKEIYNYLNIAQNSDDRTKAEFSLTYHSLSLIDVYWIKNTEERISFSKINLYDNSLSNAFVDVFLRGKGLTINKEGLDSRDISTSGQCPKAWVRENNNELVLYKDGNTTEVKNEVLASKIISCFKVDSVNYTLGMYEKKLVSKCKIITSKEYSLLNAFDLNMYCLNNDIDIYDYILKLDKYNYHMMNILDYLIGNNDRHPNNWGVLVNNKNNQIIRLYSLMDFNKSFKNYNSLTGSKCLTVKENMSQMESAIRSAKVIGLNLKKSIPRNIFKDNVTKGNMFFKRLNKIKSSI